jgi:gas vesicle protein
MPNPLSGTAANLSGTCVGTAVGAIMQEALAPKSVSELKRLMRKETTKIEVATRYFLGDYSNTGFKHGRLMDTPVTNLVYELLSRQQEDQNEKKNKFVEEDYDNISKVLICDPNSIYFVRNLEEYEKEEKQKVDAALAGVALGTAASAAVTTGVSELESGISLSDMGKKKLDYSLSTVLPAAAALGATKIGNFVSDIGAKNKTEKFNSKIKPKSINTIVDAENYKSELSENLKMMGKNPSEEVVITGNILLKTSSNYLVFMEDFIDKKYELDINRKTDLLDKLSKKNAVLVIEINSQRDDVREKTRRLAELNRDMRSKKNAPTMTDLGKLSTAQDRLNESANKLEELELEMDNRSKKYKEENGFLTDLENKKEKEKELLKQIHGNQIVKLIDKLNKYKNSGIFDKIGDILRFKKLSSVDENLSSGGSKTRKRRTTRKMRKHKPNFRKSKAKKRGKSQKAR